MCVRLTRMYGADLSQFEFDFDMTWTAFFLNADGTIYARYGARDKTDAMSHNSCKGLMQTMDRVLQMHEGYPGNKKLFKGKLPFKPKYARPELYPTRAMRRVGNSRGHRSCIHCHDVFQAEKDLAIQNGTYNPREFFRYPPPESVGVKFVRDHGTKIESVKKDSPAAKAQLAKGDEVIQLRGQSILSIADFVWVLDRARGNVDLKGQVLRDDKVHDFVLTLRGDWRPPNLAWRTSMMSMPPRADLWVSDASVRLRQDMEFEDDELALLVRGLPRRGRSSVLRRGDIITSVDGITRRMSAGDFQTHLRMYHYKKGSVLKLEVLRDDEVVKLEQKF